MTGGKTMPYARHPLKQKETQSGEIFHYSLEGLVGENEILAFNTGIGTLSRLKIVGGRVKMICETQFTFGELQLVTLFLESYPHYIPHEMLLSQYEYLDITDSHVTLCRKKLHDAIEQEGQESWNKIMRPVRQLLSKIRIKLSDFHIHVASIHESGYLLLAIPSNQNG